MPLQKIGVKFTTVRTLHHKINVKCVMLRMRHRKTGAKSVMSGTSRHTLHNQLGADLWSGVSSITDLTPMLWHGVPDMTKLMRICGAAWSTSLT